MFLVGGLVNKMKKKLTTCFSFIIPVSFDVQLATFIYKIHNINILGCQIEVEGWINVLGFVSKKLFW